MTKPTFAFQTRQACTLGLEAAVLLEFVRDLVALQGQIDEQGRRCRVSVAETQWLEWLPFLSPARFWAATDTLIDVGWLRRIESGPGTLTLELQDSATPNPAGTPAHSDPAECSPGPEAQTGDDYDMPPPMPELTPLLTDDTNHIGSMQMAPRRYSDEPLYTAMAEDRKKRLADAAIPEPATAGERSTMTLQWQPGEDCLAMIQNRGIDTEFALAQRESFVLYYRDSGQRHMSWDTKFFNWVSRRWQYHLNDSQNDFRAATPDRETGPRERRQKVRERLRNIGDVDW